MLSLFTDASLIPSDWIFQEFPSRLFDTRVQTSEVIKHPLIKELLWEIEQTTINSDWTLTTKYNEIITWDKLGNGLKTVMNQFYLCSDYNTLRFNSCVDLCKCGDNKINFMIEHKEYFNEYPMFIGYDGLSNEYPTFDNPNYKIAVNGLVMNYSDADAFLLYKFHGYDKAWTSVLYKDLRYRILENKELVSNIFKGETITVDSIDLSEIEPLSPLPDIIWE